jgi:hypothetical protein
MMVNKEKGDTCRSIFKTLPQEIFIERNKSRRVEEKKANPLIKEHAVVK